jgi:hypothetical protein
VLYALFACLAVTFSSGSAVPAYAAGGGPGVISVVEDIGSVATEDTGGYGAIDACVAATLLCVGGIGVAAAGVGSWEIYSHRSQIEHWIGGLFGSGAGKSTTDGTGANAWYALGIRMLGTSVAFHPEPGYDPEVGYAEVQYLCSGQGGCSSMVMNWGCYSTATGLWSASSGYISGASTDQSLTNNYCSATTRLGWVDMQQWCTGGPTAPGPCGHHTQWRASWITAQLITETECADMATGTVSATDRILGQTLSDSIASGDAAADVTFPACPSGNAAVGGALYSCVGVDGSRNPSCMSETSFSVPNWQTTLNDCIVGGTTCGLFVTFQGTQCDVDVAGCVDWYHDSQVHPNDYGCEFGTHVVPLHDCDVLRWQYQSTGTRTDTVTGLRTSTTPGTSTGGSTGTGTGTSSGTQSSGTNTDPSTGSTSTSTDGPQPDTTDTTGPSCMGGIWSWNPVDWVYIPIKCALKWAFVPSPTAVETSLQSIENDWTGSVVGQAIGQVGGVIGAVGNLGSSAAGCAGPALSIPPLQLTDWHPLDACSAPMSQVAGVVHVVLTLVVYVGGAIVIARLLAAAFGFDLPGFNSSGGAE